MTEKIEHLKTLIKDVLNDTQDEELLDLIYKLLLTAQ